MPLLVTYKGSILTPGHRLLKPGQVVPDGALSDELIARLVSEGHLLNTNDPRPAPSQQQKGVTVQTKSGLSTGRADDLDAISDGMASLGPKAEVPQLGLWAENPQKLKRKTLEDLNLLILEKDADITPFDTKAEAIAWLSQEWVDG